MKDKRHGDHMWIEWDGEGYFSDTHSELIYVTTEHVDMDNEVVRRALASALQRDGIADSLGDGFKMLEGATATFGWGGFFEGDNYCTVCDENGMTEYGDIVPETFLYTWVEFI